MAQKTIQVRGERYLVHEPHNWRICIKKDGNEAAYDAFYRTGWEDGGEVELFTLLPKHDDTILIQLRIYTKAISNDRVPPKPHPDIAVQCSIPAFVIVEQERQRILIQLLCRLILGPDQTVCIQEPDTDYF